MLCEQKEEEEVYEVLSGDGFIGHNNAGQEIKRNMRQCD